MHIDRRKFEINLNTIISAVTLASTIALGGYVWANTTRDIEELRRWQTDHDKVTSDRLIDNRTFRGQVEERIRAGEKSAADSDRKQDQIEYRLTVVEQQAASQIQAMEGLKGDFNDVKGDIKVMREILQRLDKSNPKPD